MVGTATKPMLSIQLIGFFQYSSGLRCQNGAFKIQEEPKIKDDWFSFHYSNLNHIFRIKLKSVMCNVFTTWVFRHNERSEVRGLPLGCLKEFSFILDLAPTMFFSQVEFLEFNTTILSIQYKHQKLECILEVPCTGDFRNAVSIVINYAVSELAA